MEDLAEEFDLRFSEAEKVRAALDRTTPRGAAAPASTAARPTRSSTTRC
jgi:hypothetical protein